MSYRLIGVVGAAALASACTVADHRLGESVKYAAALQTIDPDPVYAEDSTQPGYHGEKGAEASKRYRTDRVKDVQRVSTTSGSQGGSQGSGGPQ